MADVKNPKDVCADSRLDLSLFPDSAVMYGALAMVEGDQKYGGYNFRVTPVSASVYYSAARRHLMKWYAGEYCDLETGVPHLASALANIAILIDAGEFGMLIDDRPPCDSTQTYPLMSHLSSISVRLKEMYSRRAPRRTISGTVEENSNGEEQ